MVVMVESNERMLHRFPVLVLLAAILPAAAAGALGSLASDAPVALFGEVEASGSPVLLFHSAFEPGTLSGTVFAGQVVDRHRHINPCSGYQAYEHHHVLFNVTADGVPAPLYFEVDESSLSVVDFGDASAAVGSGPATGAASEAGTPASHLAPNPYPIHTRQPPPPPGSNTAIWARAFPTEAFLAIPAADLGFPFSGVLFLEIGNLTTTRSDQERVYRSETTTETVQCQPAPVIPPDDVEVPVYHSLRLQIESGAIEVRQGPLDRPLAYYQNEVVATPPETDREPQPPQGYWPKNEGAALRAAFDAYALPATSVSAPNLVVRLEGVAGFERATGEVADGFAMRAVGDEDLRLSGNLELQPLEAQDGGRRMRTDLDGSVFSIDVASPPAGPPWTSYAAGATGGAIVLGLALYAWPSVKWFWIKAFFAPLYARLRREEVLENELRDGILQAVQDEPGISASELGRRLECGWGTLVYHLTVLERMRLVSSAREGRHKRFFAQGRINYSDKGAVGLLVNPAARNILDAIRGAPGSIQKDLSERLHLSPGTVAWHVERLAAEGLVVKEEIGRTVRYFPSDRLLELTRQLAA